MRKIIQSAYIYSLLGLAQGQEEELPPIFEGTPEEPVLPSEPQS